MARIASLLAAESSEHRRTAIRIASLGFASAIEANLGLRPCGSLVGVLFSIDIFYNILSLIFSEIITLIFSIESK